MSRPESGAGPAGRLQHLALIPGLNNTAAVFDGMAQHWPPGVAAQALDCPPLESVEAIADALVEQLPSRFWLAGFSFGGYVALALLERHAARVEGIALICTAPFADTPQQAERRSASLAAVREGRYFQMVEAQAANAFHPDSLVNADLMAARRRMVQAYGPDTYAAHVAATIRRPDRAHLLDGRIPTCVVAAAQDQVFPPEAVSRYARAIPGAAFHCIDGAGHLLPMEQPTALAGCLAGWMRGG